MNRPYLTTIQGSECLAIPLPRDLVRKVGTSPLEAIVTKLGMKCQGVELAMLGSGDGMTCATFIFAKEADRGHTVSVVCAEVGATLKVLKRR